MTSQRMSQGGRRGRDAERGAIALLAALLVMVLGGFLALSLDVGHKFTAKAELEAATDSGALSGAINLNGTSAGVADARQAAAAFATRHYLDQTAVTINSTNDVKIGFWNKVDGKFYDSGHVVIGDRDIVIDPLTTPQFYNAVKVTAGADDQSGHNAKTTAYFGRFVGFAGGLGSQAMSAAVGGGPCDEDGNLLPLAVPSCGIADSNGSTQCGQTVTMSFIQGTGRDIVFIDATISDGSNRVHDSEVSAQIQDGIQGHAAQVNVGTALATTDGTGGGAARGEVLAMATINSLPVCTAGDPTTCPVYVIPVTNIGTDCSGHMADTTIPVGFMLATIRNVTWTSTAHTVALYINCTVLTSHQPGCPIFGLRTQSPSRPIQAIAP